MATKINVWQKVYRDIYFGGKKPRTKEGIYLDDLLSNVGRTVSVDVPDFNRINGFEPAHTETYIVTEDKCDMPAGLISVRVLASNLMLWLGRGWNVKTDGNIELA